MKIIFVGGGTAGHVNPAIYVAEHLKSHYPNTKILFVGAKNKIEEKLVREKNFDFKGLTITGFSRKINFESLKKNLITLKNIFVAFAESDKILSDFQPDICFGTGGYVTGPFLKKAATRGIKYIIHEQNCYPGLTTKLLAKNATKILLGSEGAKKFFKNFSNIIFTGNPIRNDLNKISQNEAKKILNFKNNHPVILSFGGSLGAKVINENIADVMASNISQNFNFIHGYGRNGTWFFDLLRKKSVDFENNLRFNIRKYIYDMPVCLAAADLVICRAGAITISEICACKKPAILIPSPNVAENHQFYNAMKLVNAGAAYIIEEKSLDKNVLISKIKTLFNDTSEFEKIKANLEKFSKITEISACEKICSIIKEVAKIL